MDMGNKKFDVDTVLQKSLECSEKPDAALVHRLKYKESYDMKRPTVRRTFGGVAVAAVVLMFFSVTAFAAWYLLQASEVVNQTGDATLSAAFESESAININSRVAAGDYIFTLLAVVSGADITDHPIYNSYGTVLSERTYAVIAIQAADGSPMPAPQDAEYEPFMVSPFIRGISPQVANAFTIESGHETIVEDGTLYIIFDSQDLTIFAERGVYLGINKGFVFPGGLMEVFSFDEQTGQITANSNYEGASVVFHLPFDESLADPERAEPLLNDLLSTFAPPPSDYISEPIDIEHSVDSSGVGFTDTFN